jgi:anti-sigma factor RsiW
MFVDEGTPAADAAGVERALARDHGWDMHVPPSSSEGGVQLLGGRRCLWADGRLPHLMYRINGQPVSLFVLEGVTRASADVVALGYRSRIWSRGNTTYVLVSHADAPGLTAGEDYVKREAR